MNDEIERLARENEKQRQDVIQLQYSNKSLKEEVQRKEMLQDNGAASLNGCREKGKKNDCNRGNIINHWKKHGGELI